MSIAESSVTFTQLHGNLNKIWRTLKAPNYCEQNDSAIIQAVFYFYRSNVSIHHEE